MANHHELAKADPEIRWNKDLPDLPWFRNTLISEGPVFIQSATTLLHLNLMNQIKISKWWTDAGNMTGGIATAGNQDFEQMTPLFQTSLGPTAVVLCTGFLWTARFSMYRFAARLWHPVPCPHGRNSQGRGSSAHSSLVFQHSVWFTYVHLF